MANGTQTDPAISGEMATPAQVAEARAMIKKVREAIARFHTIRRHNNERAAGLRASMVHPAQVQQMLKGSRNSQVEAQAVEALRRFITLLNGREPTQQEMQQGVPEGYEERLAVGFVPLVIGAGLIAAGAGVYSYFNYLTTIEEGNQQRTATPLERVLQALSDNVWGVAAVGAVAIGGAIYFQSSRSTSERRKVEIEKYKAAGKALDKSMHQIEKNGGEETITDKVKDLVKNVLFPMEKNPDLSPAEKLATQFEHLSEGEQSRFYRLLDGEEEHEAEESEDEESEDHGHHSHGHHHHHEEKHEKHEKHEHSEHDGDDDEEESEESEDQED